MVTPEGKFLYKSSAKILREWINLIIIKDGEDNPEGEGVKAVKDKRSNTTFHYCRDTRKLLSPKLTKLLEYTHYIIQQLIWWEIDLMGVDPMGS